MNIAEVREQYPQYNDLNDDELVHGLHQKHYSDMGFEDFATKIQYEQPWFQKDTPVEEPGIKGAIKEGIRRSMVEKAKPAKPELTPGRALDALGEGGKDVARNTLTAVGQILERQVEFSRQLEPSVRGAMAPGLILSFPKDKEDKAIQSVHDAAASELLKSDPNFRLSSGFIEDLVRMVPQFASMLTASIVGGPAAGIGVMGLQITGSIYENLVAKGVDRDRALVAGLANAAVQAPLEQIGIGRGLKWLKINKPILMKLKNLVSVAGAEWLTEFAQAVPDAITNIWAENPDKDLSEKFSMFIDNGLEMMKQGAYEGLVAATLSAATFGLAGAVSGKKTPQIKTEDTTEPPTGPYGKTPKIKTEQDIDAEKEKRLGELFEFEDEAIDQDEVVWEEKPKPKLEKVEIVQKPAIPWQPKPKAEKLPTATTDKAKLKRAADKEAELIEKESEGAAVGKTKTFNDLEEWTQGAIASDARVRNEPAESFINSEWAEKQIEIASLKDKNSSVWGDKFIHRGAKTKGPIVIGKDGVVIDGNNRLREAIDRGDTSINAYMRVDKKPTPPKQPVAKGKELIPLTKKEIVVPELSYERYLEKPGAEKDYNKWYQENKKRLDKKIEEAEKVRADREDKLGPLADRKIEFIHKLKHEHGKTLKEAKDIADDLYEGRISVDDVRVILAKPVDKKLKALPKQEPVKPKKIEPRGAEEVSGPKYPLAIMTKHGEIYKSDKAITHADLLKEFDVLPEEIARSGMFVDRKPVWEGKPKEIKVISDKEAAKLKGMPGRVVKVAKPRKAVDSEKATTFRSWVKALGGVKKEGSYRGEIDDISKGAKWQPGVVSNKGLPIDELLSEVKNHPEWSRIVKTENDILDALAKNTKKPLEGWEDKAYTDYLEREYGPDYKDSPEFRRDDKEAQRKAQESLAEEWGYTQEEFEALLKEKPPILTPEEGTLWERQAELEREGIVERPERISKKVVFPTEGIKTVPGKQKGLFGPEKGKSLDLFDIEKGFAEETIAALEHIEERGSVEVGRRRVIQKEKFKFQDPEIERRVKAAKGVKPLSLSAKAIDLFKTLKHKASREFEYLQRGGEYSEASFALRQLAKQKGVANERTLKKYIQGVIVRLGREDYNLFSRKVLLDDLVETVKTQKTEGKDVSLPFGLTEEKLNIEYPRLDEAIKDNKLVQSALEKRKVLWKALKNDYTKAMKNIGFDVSKMMKREDYFRHQVLEYVNLKGIYGTGKKLKTPTSRGFLKKRTGSELNINTDYLETESEVIAQMLYDIEVAKTIKRIDKYYNIRDKLKKQAKEQDKEIEDIIPEGYIDWQPREGNVFYFADSIPAKLAEQLTSGALEKLEIIPDQLRKSLAMGKKRKQFIIKEDLANTLDNLVKKKSDSMFIKFRKDTIWGWKIWQLISPRRFTKYNIRNLTGDADAAFAGNPAGFKYTPRAVKELYKIYTTDKPMPPDMQDWFNRGGMGSTLQVQEMGELNRLRMFVDKYERKGKIREIPKEVWNKYWKGAKLTTDFREAILRYANYLDFLEKMEKSPDGLPEKFAASLPEEVRGLHDIKDRAFLMSNDLLGAYDRVSVMGQALREHIFPFWSWKEVNFKRYYRMFANAANDGQLATMVGRKALGTAAKSPLIAYRTGKLLIKATAFWSAIQVWNHTRFPEEEKSLPEGVRTRPHIILGRNKDGTINYFSRIGAVGDLLEWFGLDSAPQYIDKWFAGRMTLKEIGKEMAKSPGNVVAQGSVPFIKLIGELATRRALFPDVFNPKTIRDRGLHFARSFGLENEYIALMKKPSKGYKKSISGLVMYKIDPLQGAYSDTFDEKRKFMKSIGKYGEGFWLTPKGNALYYLRLAMRYDDKEAFDKYMGEYLSLGGTEQGIQSSLKNMHPLSGMTQAEEDQFFLSLDDEGKHKLVKALAFYAQLTNPEYNHIPKKNKQEAK